MQTDLGQKLVPYSFRIEHDMYQLLEQEAERRSISINNLLNRMVREYMTYRTFSRMRQMRIPMDIVREVFDAIEKDRIEELARKIGSNNLVEYVGSLYHEINKDTSLRFLDVWFGRFIYEHRVHGTTHSFSVRHDINENYSLYTKELVRSFVNATIGKPVKMVQITPRTVTFSLEL